MKGRMKSTRLPLKTLWGIIAVVAVIFGGLGIVWGLTRGSTSASSSATSATSSATSAPIPTIAIIREGRPYGDDVSSSGNRWNYSPERNPSYAQTTGVQQLGFLTLEQTPASESSNETDPAATVGTSGTAGTSGTVGTAPEPVILPLFGQSLRERSSDRWVYFTATDKYQSIRIPIEYETRDCMNDDVGCRELYSGDRVTVPTLRPGTFIVSLYKKRF